MPTVNYTFPIPTVMKNLANGVDAQDAVTKSQLEATIVGNGYSNANVVAFGEAGWSGNIIPAANAIYSLGNISNQWKDLYVSNTTIYLGGVPLNVTPGNILTVNNEPVFSQNSTNNFSTTGNISADYIIGNGALLTGLPATYSNADVANYLPTYTGNLNSLQGNVTTAANVQADYFLGNGRFLTGLPEAYSNANVANYLASNANIAIVTQGNVTGNYFLGNGALLTGITTNYSNANVANYLLGNISVGNVFANGYYWANGVPFAGSGNVNVNITAAFSNSNSITYQTTNDITTLFLVDAYANSLTAAYLASNANIDITTQGNVSFTGADVSLGNVSNLHILGGSAGQVLRTDGAGNLSWITGAGGGIGNAIPLGTPTDGNLAGNNVAIDTWTDATYVTDSVDDLNEVLLNVAKNTYVGQLDFTANVTVGPSPLSVLFTATFAGNVNQYSWNFGDGNTSALGPTVAHTYTGSGSYTVSVTANNTGAAPGSLGSTASRTRTDYISLGSPLPIPSFTANRTSLDTGTSIQLTNTSQFATSYLLDWGDGNIVDPGNSWTTITHQYVAAANTDTIFNVVLTGTNQTAGPTPPYSVNSAPTLIKVYTQQTPVLTANVTNVLTGGVVSFRNDTAGAPGNTASFGAQQYYTYQWGDGTANSNVNIQAGLAGNPGAANVTRGYSITAGQQTAGTVVTYPANLYVSTGYSTSPFKSTAVNVVVEPVVTANFVGQANTVSDRTGDTALTGYVFTDYLGNDRALFNFENQTSPTPPYGGNSFSWDWGDGTFTNTTSGGNVTHSWTSTGAKTVALTSQGLLSAIAQSNTFTRNSYVTIAANPTAPTDLSAYTLTLGTASQGTSPALAAGATDQTGSAPAAGTAVTRYATATPIVSGTVDNANTASTGTLTAFISNTATGQATFTATGNAVGTYSALEVLVDADAHTAISANTYPSYFYKVFDARISQALSNIGVGYNTFKLAHTVSGNTTAPAFVRDNLTVTATVGNAGASVTQTSAGTLLYISGVPYYTTGAAVDISNVTVANLTGQTYANIPVPLTLISGTNYENTTGSIIALQTKTYAQMDGAVSMLTGGIPNANVGISSSYTLGNLSANINGSVKAVATIGAYINNVNGQGATTQMPTRIQLYSGSITGINEAAIPVSDSLGSIYTDDGVRITGFGTAANTPAFSGSTNYYTGNAWSGAVTVAGTQESTVRWGNASHFTTDLSTGYLPAGPDLNTGRSGLQYFTFAFRRATVANFDIILSGTVAGVWFAAPGTQIDTTSGLNGWLDCSQQYAGSGIPGSGTGGNGSDGCAVTGGDIIPLNTAISNQRYTQTLGAENSSNATGNNILIRIALAAGQSISDIQIGVAT